MPSDATLARDFPASHGGWTVTVESLHDSVVGSFGRATWLLLAAVTVVLLVTCLNVGGLLVARAVVRDRETAAQCAGAATLVIVAVMLTRRQRSVDADGGQQEREQTNHDGSTQTGSGV